MNLEQLRARLAEIGAQAGAIDAANAGAEELEQLNALNEEFDAVSAKIEALEKQAKIAGAVAAPQARKTVSASPSATASVSVGKDRIVDDPKAGFKHQGEFYLAVIKATSGAKDERLLKYNAANGGRESVGEDGGYLIPPDFRQDINKKVMGDESLLPRTSLIQTTRNHITLPVDETAPWDASQGIIAYWESEAGTYDKSKPKFGQANIKLNKLTAMVPVTDELLEDAISIDSYIRTKAPEVMVAKVNSALIAGSGVGMPKGLLNSAFKYKVSKEGSQSADTVLFPNVNKMFGRLLPTSALRAVWLCHPQVLENLRAMAFDEGATAGKVPVYLPPTGVAGSPYGTLFGRPIMPMMGGVKALGDEGDLILADFSHYLAAVKTSGVQADISTHVYFVTGETAFRFTQRIGGDCPYKNPVSTQNGSFSMSGFVTLEDR